jgi:hypothetical protein
MSTTITTTVDIINALKNETNKWKLGHDRELLRSLKKIAREIDSNSNLFAAKLLHLENCAMKVSSRLNVAKVALNVCGNTQYLERKILLTTEKTSSTSKEGDIDDDSDSDDLEDLKEDGDFSVRLGDLNDDEFEEDYDKEAKREWRQRRNAQLMEAIRLTEKRWLGKNALGDLKLTGNVFWKPLPHVVGTAQFYQDSTLGLSSLVNPNPQRYGPYISSTDDDDDGDDDDNDASGLCGEEETTSDESSVTTIESESEDDSDEDVHVARKSDKIQRRRRRHNKITVVEGHMSPNFSNKKKKEDETIEEMRKRFAKEVLLLKESTKKKAGRKKIRGSDDSDLSFSSDGFCSDSINDDDEIDIDDESMLFGERGSVNYGFDSADRLDNSDDLSSSIEDDKNKEKKKKRTKKGKQISKADPIFSKSNEMVTEEKSVEKKKAASKEDRLRGLFGDETDDDEKKSKSAKSKKKKKKASSLLFGSSSSSSSSSSLKIKGSDVSTLFK